jgi:hypothetical protein
VIRATGLALAVVALVSACNSSNSNGTGDAAGGGKDGLASTPCPSQAPSQGAACSGAASCAYGEACNQTVSVCTGGFWENSPAVVTEGGACPTSAPDPGAACALCESVTCTFDSDCDLDGGVRIAAKCTSGAWAVSKTDCPFDAGSPEAGPTDGGDGGDASDAGDASDGNADASSEGGDAHADGP